MSQVAKVVLVTGATVRVTDIVALLLPPYGPIIVLVQLSV
jgi:hypothetical protein